MKCGLRLPSHVQHRGSTCHQVDSGHLFTLVMCRLSGLTATHFKHCLWQRQFSGGPGCSLARGTPWGCLSKCLSLSTASLSSLAPAAAGDSETPGDPPGLPEVAPASMVTPGTPDVPLLPMSTPLYQTDSAGGLDVVPAPCSASQRCFSSDPAWRGLQQAATPWVQRHGRLMASPDVLPAA